jgi:hypothetical protein
MDEPMVMRRSIAGRSNAFYSSVCMLASTHCAGIQSAGLVQGDEMSQPKSKLSRRTLFAGVGTLGAVAATVTLLPHAVVEETASAPALKPAPDKGGGYQLTEHVKRYYKSTLV